MSPPIHASQAVSHDKSHQPHHPHNPQRNPAHPAPNQTNPQSAHQNHPNHTHPNPLILTLTLDPQTQNFLTSLRTRYFPKPLNHLSAHITLFHAIPRHRRAELDTHLSQLSADAIEWDVFIGEPSKMGQRGVMLSVRDRPRHTILDMQGYIRDLLRRGVKEDRDRLTDQDSRVGGRVHVTVLNKAGDEAEVEKCLEEVKGDFEGMKKPGEQFGQVKGKAVGLELWEYQGGPWKSLKQYHFGKA